MLAKDSKRIKKGGKTNGGLVVGVVKRPPQRLQNDSGGRVIVISGGINPNLDKDNTHDRNWGNFVISAKTQIERAQAEDRDIPIEWFIQKSSLMERAKNDGRHQAHYTWQVERLAEDLNVGIRWFDTDKDFVQLINTNSQNEVRRDGDRIKSLTFFGHGSVGDWWLTYEPGMEPGYRITGHNLYTKSQLEEYKAGRYPVVAGYRLPPPEGYEELQIKPSVFVDGANCKSWACDSGATGDAGQMSFVDLWKRGTGQDMEGLVGKSNYAGANTSRVRKVQELMKRRATTGWMTFPEPEPFPFPSRRSYWRRSKQKTDGK